MSANCSDGLVELRIGFSVRYFFLILFLHVSAAAALFYTSLNGFLIVVPLGILTFHGYSYFKKNIFLKSGDSVRALRFYNDCWYVESGNVWRRVWISGEYFVSPWLIAIRFKDREIGRAYSVNLFSDSATTEAIHRLRLLLMLKKPGSD